MPQYLLEKPHTAVPAYVTHAGEARCKAHVEVQMHAPTLSCNALPRLRAVAARSRDGRLQGGGHAAAAPRARRQQQKHGAVCGTRNFRCGRPGALSRAGKCVCMSMPTFKRPCLQAWHQPAQLCVCGGVLRPTGRPHITCQTGRQVCRLRAGGQCRRTARSSRRARGSRTPR
jgi:hypothetical protein